jgi:hypothetical protein
MTKKTIKKVVKKPKKIKLSLDLKGLVFSAEADTFKEAIEKIYKDSFGKVKTWGVVILEKDGKKAEFQYRPIQIKRAMVGRFAQELLERRLNMLLK